MEVPADLLYIPGEYEEQDGDPEVGKDHVDPHVHRQRLHEGEELGRLLLRLLVEDADPQVHEGHREVHGLLPLVGDGQVGNSQVILLHRQTIIN